MNNPEPHVEISDKEKLIAYLEAQRPQLIAYISRNMGPELKRKVEPEDVLQEVTVTALGSVEQFQVPGRVPFKLLCQICEQRIIDAHRFHFAEKRAADKEKALDPGGNATGQGGLIGWLAASITSPSKAFSRSERELRLEQAIGGLTDTQRAALQLRYVEGLSTKEVAERLGKTDGAIRVLLTRTVADLQERLMESG
ncbi:MAG: sigma-70 family RNA polymerase sigma factor [Planctomycetales bacterium]